MLGKKSSERSEKNVFLYSHQYRDQNVGGKTRETIFPEKHEKGEQKMLGKNRRKKCEKRFFIFTRKS